MTDRYRTIDVPFDPKDGLLAEALNAFTAEHPEYQVVMTRTSVPKACVWDGSNEQKEKRSWALLERNGGTQ